jgi:hypothetical protein
MNDLTSEHFHDPVIAVHGTLAAAHRSMLALRRGDFDVNMLSILSNAVLCSEADHENSWEEIQGLWPHLRNSASFPTTVRIPHIGDVVACGPFGTAMIAKLRNPKTPRSKPTLSKVLIGMGMPRHSALNCESYVKAACIAIIVHGPYSDIARALSLLNAHHKANQHHSNFATNLAMQDFSS